MSDIKPGFYKHFKGGKCKVLGVAKHSETLEELVVYIHLGLYNSNEKDSLWVRPVAMFKELVNVGSKKVPRFEYIGPKLK